jgi:uncharacterized Fe-S cluster-containing MiaB family protein
LRIGIRIEEQQQRLEKVVGEVRPDFVQHRWLLEQIREMIGAKGAIA